MGDLLFILEMTELSRRVPPTTFARWAIDCARRAVGVDLRALDAHVIPLREGLDWARTRLRRGPGSTGASSSSQEAAVVQGCRRTLESALSTTLEASRRRRDVDRITRALAAVEATRCAMRCAEGGLEHEAAARSAQAAFLEPDTEARAQASRLLLRAELLPSGAEILVRLDYAEARGKLPRDPDARQWIEDHRHTLMLEDPSRSLAFVLRDPKLVFLAELERISCPP